MTPDQIRTIYRKLASGLCPSIDECRWMWNELVQANACLMGGYVCKVMKTIDQLGPIDATASRKHCDLCNGEGKRLAEYSVVNHFEPCHYEPCEACEGTGYAK